MLYSGKCALKLRDRRKVQVDMDKIRKTTDLLDISLNVERLRILTPILSHTVRTVKPLMKQGRALPKEHEPGTFFALLMRVGKGESPEDI